MKTVQDIIAKLNNGLSAELDGSMIVVGPPDYDIYPSFAITQHGIMVKCSAFGELGEITTITWDELSQIKKELESLD